MGRGALRKARGRIEEETIRKVCRQWWEISRVYLARNEVSRADGIHRSSSNRYTNRWLLKYLSNRNLIAAGGVFNWESFTFYQKLRYKFPFYSLLEVRVKKMFFVLLSACLIKVSSRWSDEWLGKKIYCEHFDLTFNSSSFIDEHSSSRRGIVANKSLTWQPCLTNRRGCWSSPWITQQISLPERRLKRWNGKEGDENLRSISQHPFSAHPLSYRRRTKQADRESHCAMIKGIHGASL